MIDSGMGDFLQQLPVAFIVIFCGSGLALIGAIVLIANARARKATTSASVSASAPRTPAPVDYGVSDMPDLDVLLRSDNAPAPPRNVKQGTYSVSLAGGETIDAAEVLTVMRDLAGGGLIVQVGDKTRRVTKDMGDSEFQQKLSSILKELARASGLASQPAPANTSKVEPAPQAAIPAAEPAAPVPETKPEPIAAKKPQAEASPRLSTPPSARSAAFDLPTYSLDTPTPTTRRDLKRAIGQPVPELDIAGRIEAFLQHKLATIDLFAGRALHVLPADDGIRIQVDETFYDAVDEIEDAEVRAFLQTTIQEWQDRQ